MANHRCFSHFSSDQQYTCDAGLPVIPTYHTSVCHAEQSWSIPTAFLLDETKPKEAARSRRSGCDVLWPLPCCLQNQTETSRRCKVSLNVFSACIRFLAPKVWLLEPWSCCALHLHRLLALPRHFGSEHLLPAGTFWKDPELCSSCIFQWAWSRHAYSNLGWKLTDLCLLKVDSLLPEIAFWQFHR